MIELSDVQKDLKEVCAKHGLTHASFCASDDQGKFIGLAGIDLERTADQDYQMDQLKPMATIFNVGRLWQYCRENTRSILNSFEGRF